MVDSQVKLIPEGELQAVMIWMTKWASCVTIKEKGIPDRH